MYERSNDLVFDDLSEYRVKASKDYRLALIWGNSQVVDLLSVKDISKRLYTPKIPYIVGSLYSNNPYIQIIDVAWGPPELTPENGSLIAVLDSVGYLIIYQYITVDYWSMCINLNITMNWRQAEEGKIFIIEWSPIQPLSMVSLMAIGATTRNLESGIVICLIGKTSTKRLARIECDTDTYQIDWAPDWVDNEMISLTINSRQSVTAYCITLTSILELKLIYKHSKCG